jgi:hypothetical protein
MEFTGFGLSRWGYTHKPRKPYEFGNRSVKDSQIFHDNLQYHESSVTDNNNKTPQKAFKAKKDILTFIISLMILLLLLVLIYIIVDFII